MTSITARRAPAGFGLGAVGFAVTALVLAVGLSAVIEVRTSSWGLLIFGALYLAVLLLHVIVHLEVAARLVGVQRAPRTLGIALVSDCLLVVGFLLQYDSSGSADWLMVTALHRRLTDWYTARPPSWWPTDPLLNPLLFLPVAMTYRALLRSVPDPKNGWRALRRSRPLWLGLLGGAALVVVSTFTFEFVVAARRADRADALQARVEALLPPSPGAVLRYARPRAQFAPEDRPKVPDGDLQDCVAYRSDALPQQIVDHYVSLLESQGRRVHVRTPTRLGWGLHTIQGVGTPEGPSPVWDGGVSITPGLHPGEYSVCSMSFDSFGATGAPPVKTHLTRYR